MKLLAGVYEKAQKRNPNEPEFLQAVEEVFESLEIVAERYTQYVTDGIFERLTEPERVIMFRVRCV